jgi:hypothetical protein
MQRKITIIFLIGFVILIASVLGVYFATKAKNANNGTQTQTPTDYQSFNPFGTGTQTPATNTTTNPNSSTNQEVTVPAAGTNQVSLFHKLTAFAVAGATFFEDTRPLPQQDTPTVTTTAPTTKSKTPPAPTFETVPALRYIERATGHIYEMYLDTGLANKISDSTIPSIYEAFFDAKASTIIYRYLGSDNRTVTSYMATLGGSQGEFLPSNITDVSLSPDRSKFFYIAENSSNASGTTRSFSDTKKTQVFSSPFTEWLSQWVTSEKIFLTTKASYSTTGSLFVLNTATGTLSKIFGGIVGLTTLSNNTGTKILYSMTQNTGPRLLLFDPNKHLSITTPFYTLPEKCVWSQDNINVYCAVPKTITGSQYPDVWYQGQTSFNDQFIKINTETSIGSTIADSTTETAVDGTHLFLNKDESTLFFINKKDSTLWSLNLK